MAEEITTEKLKIPRIRGDQPLLRRQFNNALDYMDEAVLPLVHADTKAHLNLWRAQTAYAKQDVIRTSSCPSWGFYMCVQSGTSGKTEPKGYGEGDVLADGSCIWVLKKFGGAAGQTGIDVWRNGRLYEEGTLVLYRRLLHRCAAEHQAGANFEPEKWQLLNLGYLPDWEAGQVYEKAMLVVESGAVQRCLKYHTAYDFAQDKATGCWEAVLAGGGTKVILSENAPALSEVKKGDLWFEILV